MEYAQEQLNYFRLCYVVFYLLPVGLRQIFKKEWDFLYKATLIGEWKDTAQNGHDFYIKESKRSRKKNARYLTTIRSGNTGKWDSSCLFFAILYSDSVGTTLSPAIQKEVDDIRQVRNEIAHITIHPIEVVFVLVCCCHQASMFHSIPKSTLLANSNCLAILFRIASSLI